VTIFKPLKLTKIIFNREDDKVKLDDVYMFGVFTTLCTDNSIC
jgi:hypothetical protein